MVISFMEIKCISIELISRFCNFYSFGHHSFMVAYNTVPIFLVEWNQKELYQRIEIFEYLLVPIFVPGTVVRCYRLF